MAALCGVLALTAWSHTRGTVRAAAVALSVALVAGIGASRVLLGAHYPTDVLAGWLTGATVAALCWEGSRLAMLLPRRRGVR